MKLSLAEKIIREADYAVASAGEVEAARTLLAAVERVRQMHSPLPAQGWCPACKPPLGEPVVWPCPTYRALDGE